MDNLDNDVSFSYFLRSYTLYSKRSLARFHVNIEH